MNMKPVPELELGFRDAENYRRRENRELKWEISVNSLYGTREVTNNGY